MSRRDIIVFVIGPYRADSEWEVVQNIRKAEAMALDVWREGFTAICPHKNTAMFGGALPDEAWLIGDREILSRCDAVILVDGYKYSSGSISEINIAKSLDIPIFEDINELLDSQERGTLRCRM